MLKCCRFCQTLYIFVRLHLAVLVIWDDSKFCSSSSAIQLSLNLLNFHDILNKNKMNLDMFCGNEKFYNFSLIFCYVAVAAHAVVLILAFFADFWQAQYFSSALSHTAASPIAMIRVWVDIFTTASSPAEWAFWIVEWVSAAFGSVMLSTPFSRPVILLVALIAGDVSTQSTYLSGLSEVRSRW